MQKWYVVISDRSHNSIHFIYYSVAIVVLAYNFFEQYIPYTLGVGAKYFKQK